MPAAPSGKPLHVAGTVNRYETSAFAQEAISCDAVMAGPKNT